MRVDTELERFLGTIKPVGHGMKLIERLQIADKAYFTSDEHLRQQARADWRFVDLRVQAWAGMYIHLLRKLNIPVFVHCAFRTPLEQASAYARGASNLAGPTAPHVQGMAVDIVHSKMPWRCTKEEYAWFNKIAREAAEKVGVDMEYGYTWGWDSCHFELRNWRTLMGHPSDVFRAMEIQKEPWRQTARWLYVNRTRGFTQPTKRAIIERNAKPSQLAETVKQYDRNR